MVWYRELTVLSTIQFTRFLKEHRLTKKMKKEKEKKKKKKHGDIVPGGQAVIFTE